MPETQWMTLLETADIMKRLPIQVTRMCEDGKLEYYMEDGRYFVSRESIDLFMHPRTGGPAPPDPDTNGTARRKYGRAPDDFSPSSESAAESETTNGRDEAEAATELETTNGRDEAEAAGEEETGRIVEEARGTDEEKAEAREDVATPEIAEVAAREVEETQENAETREEFAPQVDAQAQEDEEQSHATEHLEEGSQMEPVDDATQTEETLPGQGAAAESPIQEKDRAESMAHPGDPNARAMEILTDLRAATARHAKEHKAFCDEIAGLADALESTLSQDGDKTGELTREISSLLARYTRR
ncbi:MAG: hypothetical protein OXG98_15795 [Gemmatimonadetes bacterium]|nr:hypothetical protein [Gemmatimonadota bacterium]